MAILLILAHVFWRMWCIWRAVRWYMAEESWELTSVIVPLLANGNNKLTVLCNKKHVIWQFMMQPVTNISPKWQHFLLIQINAIRCNYMICNASSTSSWYVWDLSGHHYVGRHTGKYRCQAISIHRSEYKACVKFSLVIKVLVLTLNDNIRFLPTFRRNLLKCCSFWV